MLKMKKKNDTLQEKLEEFFADREYNGCCAYTIRGYRQKLRVVFSQEDLEEKISDVNWNRVVHYINSKDITDYSKFSYIKELRTFMNWLGVKELPKSKHIETVKETYTDEELKKLMKKPGKDCSFAEYRTWCIELLVIDTGVRAGTIREILIRDIDLTGCILVTRHNKTGHTQVLPFSRTTRDAIKTYLDSRGGTLDSYLFCDIFENQMSRNTLRLSVARFNKSRGVDKTSIHLLRHSFSRKWLENGGNVLTLQKMLGHTTLKMSEHYAKIFDSSLLEQFKSNVECLKAKRKRIDRQ